MPNARTNALAKECVEKMTCANATQDTQVWTAPGAYVCLERPGEMRLLPMDTPTITLNAPDKENATEKAASASVTMASLVTDAGTLPAQMIAMAMEPASSSPNWLLVPQLLLLAALIFNTANLLTKTAH